MKQNDPATIERPLAPELVERRYVYNGEPQVPSLDGVPRGNRPIRKRKRSPFNIIIVTFTISVLIVFYVWNKIVVNRLAIEVNDLQMQYQKISYTNEVLRAEINKKSSLERIGKVASDRLGMTYPKEQPVWFMLDDNQLTKLHP